jgi:hypothetical protein
MSIRSLISPDGEVYLSANDIEHFVHIYADDEARSAGGPVAAMAIRRIAVHIADARDAAESERHIVAER